MESIMSMNRIKEAMDEYGATRANWRIKLQGIEHDPRDDWMTMTVNVYKPRCRKPCTTWELAIWIPGKLLRWDMSKFYNY